jgi:hypothetical protein
VLEIESRLREIGEKAFFGCNKLKAFCVPSSVEIIGDRCFEKCFGLENVTSQARSPNHDPWISRQNRWICVCGIDVIMALSVEFYSENSGVNHAINLKELLLRVTQN